MAQKTLIRHLNYRRFGLKDQDFMQIKIKENCGKQTFDLEATEHELLSLTSDEGKPASSEAEKWSALNTCLSSSSFFRSFCLLLLWASDLKWRTGVSVLFMAKHLHLHHTVTHLVVVNMILRFTNGWGGEFILWLI